MKKSLSLGLAATLMLSAFQLSSFSALAATYTLADVQTHNTAANCWTVVGSNVYNLTSYIAAHPGGVGAISSICGVNGTATFTAMHGSSATAQAALASLLVGTLATTVVDTTAPSIPTNLTATAISSSQINLTWSASTDNVAVTGYNLYRNGVLIGTSSNLLINNIGLTASTTYNYAVAAYDATGNLSAKSATVSATTLATGASTTPVTPPTNGKRETEHENEHDKHATKKAEKHEVKTSSQSHKESNRQSSHRSR
jgi:cytochrome b involved in lipid metabolism